MLPPNLMLLYGSYMNNTWLKWRCLLFLYTLSCFNLLVKDDNFNLVAKWVTFAQQDVCDDTNIPCIRFWT